jgi:hypothetical protein
MTKNQTQDLVRVATTLFAAYSAYKAVKQAREDEDGLQLTEAVLRGLTLTLSIAILVRNLRHHEDVVPALTPETGA